MLPALPFFAAGFLVQVAPAVDLTLPPETAQLVTILEGRGVQTYACTAEPTGYRWVFQAPEAQLFNLATGKQQGRHDAGPSWTYEDGSAVLGSVHALKPADSPADVPWLLLQTRALSSIQGVLTPVTYVRRYNTHGGAAPGAGCDTAHVGTSLRVPYTATYAFYSNAQAPSLLIPAPPAASAPPPQ